MAFCQNLLGTKFKILLCDERVVIGSFVCIDSKKNIVLRKADEVLPGIIELVL